MDAEFYSAEKNYYEMKCFHQLQKTPTSCVCKYVHKRECEHRLQVANKSIKEETSLSLKYGPQIKL